MVFAVGRGGICDCGCARRHLRRRLWSSELGLLSGWEGVVGGASPAGKGLLRNQIFLTSAL